MLGRTTLLVSSSLILVSSSCEDSFLQPHLLCGTAASGEDADCGDKTGEVNLHSRRVNFLVLYVGTWNYFTAEQKKIKSKNLVAFVYVPIALKLAGRSLKSLLVGS